MCYKVSYYAIDIFYDNGQQRAYSHHIMLWNAIWIHLNPTYSQPNNEKCGGATHKSFTYVTSVVQICNMNHRNM